MSSDRKNARVAASPRQAPGASSNRLAIIVAVAAVAALAVVALFLLQPRTPAPAAPALAGPGEGLEQPPADTPAVSLPAEGETARVTPVEAQDGQVRLTLADISDGQAHFYSIQAGDKTVPFFVLMGSDGKIRAALDACVVCYEARKGYRQEGDVMVCNNCGNRFPSANINVITGGCNPVPVERQEQDGYLILSAAELAAGAEYF